MYNNKFYLSFNLVTEGESFWSPQKTVDFVLGRLAVQAQMLDWCLKNIGSQDFGKWQFGNSFLTTDGNLPIEIYNGIFIFKDEDKVAFKLAFGI
jgi:hypothetical protein